MIRESVLAFVLLAAIPLAAIDDDVGVAEAPYQPPKITVMVHKVYARPGEIPESILEKNPHEVVAIFEPTPDDRHTVARYTVIPGDRPEWVCADWDDYHFHFRVKLPTTAIVQVFRDGKPLIDLCSSMLVSHPPRDPMDPEVLQDRLEWAEKRVNADLEIRHRINNVLFYRPQDHWLDANCTLEDNVWGYTNDWIVRELDLELIRALSPPGPDGGIDKKYEDFFSKWQQGDRLFSYGTPRHLQGPVSGEWGYLIIRECQIVAKLMVIIS